MTIRKFRAGRVPNATASTWVGEVGTMFYDEATGQLKIADGRTPGGRFINLVVATSTQLGGIKAGAGANVAIDGTLTIDTTGLPLSIGDLAIAQANISTANPNENLNLITNGTGAINIVGNLHVHTTAQGPDYPTPILEARSNGNVYVNGNLVTNGNTIINGATTFNGVTIRNGETISNGNVTWNGNTITNGPAYNNGPTVFNGNVTITGNTSVAGNTRVVGSAYLTGNSYIIGNTFVNGPTTVTGNITVTGNSVQTGLSTYIVSTNSSNYGAVEITGNSQGLSQPPVLPGVMLHVTGQDNGTTPGRVYVDSNQQYSIIVGRRFDGTIANPTQVLAGEEVFRLAGTGYPTGGWPTTGVAQIRYIADENQTQTNRGGHLDFLTVPIGSNVVTQVMSVSATTGVDISGNITAGNIAVSSAGTLTTPRIVINDGGIRTINGGTTCTIDFATDSIILWTAPSGTAAITLSNYTAGARVKLIIAMTTSRDVTYGISSAANSSDGNDNFNGAGGGAVSIANTAMHLDYTCITALAAGCYVAVTVN